MVTSKNVKTSPENRIQRLRSKVFGLLPEVCIERGYYLTESYRETESDPTVIRRAKAVANILAKLSISIEEDELIVGKSTSKRRGCLLTPEIQWEWYLKEIDKFSTRDYDRCAPISEEDKATMKEFLPYWKGRALYDKWVASVPPEAMKLHYNSLYITNSGCVSGVHLAHHSIDYEKLLTLGLNGIKSEIMQARDTINLTGTQDLEKYQFLSSMIITLEAAMSFASRYAALAENLASKEKNPTRKQELERIAINCRQVPANPAHNLYEALQSIWLVYIVLRNEGLGPGIGFGRPDQYLYRFFKKDIDEGLISRDEAIELIALLLIKINDSALIMSSEFGEQLAGFPTLANITLGGVDKSGKSAVNDLSFLFLEAEKEVRFTIEEYVIRVNRNTPDAFLIKACEVARALKGKFKFISDDTAIQQLLTDGKPVEYARSYAVVGCFTPSVPAYSYDTSAAMVNLPLMLELALNNGKSRLSGEQLGPRTGDPKKFKSFDNVWEAYKKQVESFIPTGMLLRAADRHTYANYAPCPFLSSFFAKCIETGLDVTNGGTAPYSTEGQGLVGSPNVGDSLAAIKKVIFEDKKATMTQLIEALDNNFRQADDLLNALKCAPKFGNDDDYVDSIVNEVLSHASNQIRQYTGISGTRPTVAASAGTGHLGLGTSVGALPDGRKAREPLSEGGISPYQGRNVNGPTSTMRSVAKLDHLKLTGGSVFNMRFNPDVLKDGVKLRKFAALLRTYCETGGYLVQFNIIDADTLRDAQKNPQQYRDLLVRVATYSAYFVELSPRLQNDIIARTEFHEI